MGSLTAEQRADIDDHILARGYLAALIRIREVCGVSLSDAKSLHWERYYRLRAERAMEFACSHEEYCAGILE